MKHRSKAYSELHTLMLSLRNDTKKDLSVLCSGMRSRTLDKILDTRAARKKEGQLLKMNDVLKIKSKGKSAFVSDPSAATLAKYIVYYEDRFATGKELNKMVIVRHSSYSSFPLFSHAVPSYSLWSETDIRPL